MIWRILEPTRSPTFEALAQVIGLPATRALIASRPLTGPRERRFVYVPAARSLTADHPIARAIGPNAARDLCAAFGGELIELPQPFDRTAHRKNLVFQLWARGVTNPRAIWEKMTNGGAEPWASRYKLDTIKRDVAALRAIAREGLTPSAGARRGHRRFPR